MLRAGPKKKKVNYPAKTVGKAVRTWFCTIEEVFVQDKSLKKNRKEQGMLFLLCCKCVG